MVITPFSEIGLRIQKLRRSKNYSQIEFAELIDISPSHLSSIEMGKTRFGIDILMRITDVLQVPADVILKTDLPETKPLAAVYMEEISKELGDCSESDALRLLTILREIKGGFDEARRENGQM